MIAITRSGYIKRLPVTAYREQRRGGIGVMGMDLKDEDYIEHLFVASTHDYILFFTSVGKVYRLKVHELPLGSRQSKGRAIVNLLPFRQGETVRAVIQTRSFEEAKYLLFATKNGVVKKTELAAYNTPLKADGIIAIKMREGDELVGVRHSTGDDDVLMVSRIGQAIRFSERDVRAMGRDASGVQGMRLRGDDEVISVAIAADDADLLVVTENGYGKRTRVSEYPKKGRGGMGVKTIQLTEARGQLVGARVVRDGYQVMLISTGGTVIKMPVEDVKRLGRSTQGVIVMRLREGELVSSLAPVVESGDDEPTNGVAERRAAEPAEPSAGRQPRFSTSFRLAFPFANGGRYKCRRGVARPTKRGPRMAYQQTGRPARADRSCAEHLDKIELYLGQVCAIAGISKMQLDYWTNKAQIPTKGKKQRIYDMDAVETVMLIKQAKDKGLNLGAAIDAARRFRELKAAASSRRTLVPAGRRLSASASRSAPGRRSSSTATSRARSASAGSGAAARSGARSITFAASFSRSDAWNSPSAAITFARRSRSASAWRAIARCMPCGISTSFTSTIETLMPHGAVCLVDDPLQDRVDLLPLGRAARRAGAGRAPSAASSGRSATSRP